MKVIEKLRVIILSRTKNQNKQPSWVLDRRKECLKCDYNSDNTDNIGLYKMFLILMSDLLSLVTFKKSVDNLGNCTKCASCSIYFKTFEEDEECPIKKWKK